MKWPSRTTLIGCLFCAMVFPQATFAQNILRNTSVMLRQTAQMYERAAQFPQAADYYTRACVENPADVSAYLGAKRMFLQLQEYVKFESLIRTLQQKRRDIRYPVDLALIDYKKGDEKAALEKWQRALDENSTNQQAYSLVGQAMIENQLYESALKTYDRGRSALKNSSAYIFELASIYKALNQFDKLVNEYANYLKSNPAQVGFIQSDIQQLGREEGNVEPLIKELEKATTSHAQVDWALHIFLGDLFSTKKRYADALNHYVKGEASLAAVNDKHLKSSYKAGSYIYTLGDLALKANDPVQAQRAFQIVIQDYADGPFRTQAELGLTHVYLYEKAYEEAILSLESFIDNNKKSLDTRRALMLIGDICFEHLFQLDRARTAYLRAFNEFPNSRMQIETLFKLADCALASDSLEAAEDYLLDAEKKSGSNETDLKKNAMLRLAWLELYSGHPKKSLDYVLKLSEPNPDDSEVNFLENDALELMILLQENSHDSVSLAAFGISKFLTAKRQYVEAVDFVEDYLQSNQNVLLRSELRLHLSMLYQYLHNYDAALSTLLLVYEDDDSLYRDKALMTAGEVLEKNFDKSDAASERYEALLEEFPHSIFLEQARNRIRALREQRENL